ncbi:hypothetical protein BS47DRAFT_1390926 [Hydnum rufescens UP504]|uniref:Uncharacterized protein n=1 Tax=Hydnum rufescens UP504 TaxID=1448309 RepID=A0A9P6B2D3_9AGAM|nr:hypothetical protein BS47DRAFT_1390926 [Hydnum rufescens UP504]
MGVDETLIGTIFAYPVLQADSQWLEELLEDGVLTFGVVEGPMQSGVRSIKELPEGVQVAAPEGRVLPTSRHIVCVEHHLAHILHPEPWQAQPPSRYPGNRLPGSHEPLEQCLLHELFPDPIGPFPLSTTEVEITSQIDRLSLKDSNPSTHIPSAPINDSVNDAEDPYAKFWDQSSEGLPYDDNSDISSYDLTPSDTVVKSTRVAKIGVRQKQTQVEAEAINKAAQLLSKAQKGDWEAKAEIIQRINAEHGRKNGVRSRDGKPLASPGVVYLRQHFINPDNIESNNQKHEKRLCWQTAEIAEANAQARLILVFPPIATILPVPILIPVLDLAPLPITLIIPGFPTILLSSVLPSMVLHVPLLLLQLQAFNPASQYQPVPGHLQTL